MDQRYNTPNQSQELQFLREILTNLRYHAQQKNHIERKWRCMNFYQTQSLATETVAERYRLDGQMDWVKFGSTTVELEATGGQLSL